MTWCMVQKKNGYVKVPATRIVEREGMVYAYNGEELTGVFDLGAVDMCYLSREVRG